MCNSTDLGYVIVSNSKDPQYTIVEAICTNQEAAERAIKRYNLESGSNAISSLYKVLFLGKDKCNRFRDPFSKKDDGEQVAYVVSDVIGNQKMPAIISASIEEAERYSEDGKRVIDLVHIKDS